jgi:hypothetical protein
MNLTGVTLSCLVTIACGSAGAGPQTTDGDSRDGGYSQATALAAIPTTVEVQLAGDTSQRLKDRLDRRSLEVARLVLHDLRPHGASSLKGIRVFVEKPDADLSTPLDDPHYVSSFILGLEPSQTFLWNIAPTLSRLRELGRHPEGEHAPNARLRVTFVPEPWDAAKGLEEDLALPFSSVTIEVPPGR